LHPDSKEQKISKVKKKKKKQKHQKDNMRRTETAVDKHERIVLLHFQRLRQNKMQPANDQQTKPNHYCIVICHLSIVNQYCPLNPFLFLTIKSASKQLELRIRGLQTWARARMVIEDSSININAFIIRQQHKHESQAHSPVSFSELKTQCDWDFSTHHTSIFKNSNSQIH
jgi:hypothetical protein